MNNRQCVCVGGWWVLTQEVVVWVPYPKLGWAAWLREAGPEREIQRRFCLLQLVLSTALDHHPPPGSGAWPGKGGDLWVRLHPCPKRASESQDGNTPHVPRACQGLWARTDCMGGGRETWKARPQGSQQSARPAPCPPPRSITHPGQAPQGLPTHRRNQGPSGAAEGPDAETNMFCLQAQ